MAIRDLGQLNAMHLDVLREIGNIGAGNAATALAQMLNREIGVTTPSVRILDIAEAGEALGGPETPAASILVELYGQISGVMMFVVNKSVAEALLERLLGKSRVDCLHLSEMERSAFSELGNIMVGSYTRAVASLSGLNIKMTVPAVTCDMVGSLLTVPAAEMGADSDKIIFIEDDFINPNRAVSANMMLIPRLESLNKLMDSLGISL